MSRGCKIIRLTERNALKKPFAQVDPSFASMLLKYVNKLKEIDQIKEEERAMVRMGEDIYGAVAPSDGGKTGAGSCVYILTEKVDRKPTMEEDLRVMVDLPVATRLVDSGLAQTGKALFFLIMIRKCYKTINRNSRRIQTGQDLENMN